MIYLNAQEIAALKQARMQGLSRNNLWKQVRAARGITNKRAFKANLDPADANFGLLRYADTNQPVPLSDVAMNVMTMQQGGTTVSTMVTASGGCTPQPVRPNVNALRVSLSYLREVVLQALADGDLEHTGAILHSANEPAVVAQGDIVVVSFDDQSDISDMIGALDLS